MPDAPRIIPRIISAYDRPVPVGTPADRATLREHMPWSRDLIEEHWREFGGLAEVVAVEAGYVYRWSK